MCNGPESTPEPGPASCQHRTSCHQTPNNRVPPSPLPPQTKPCLGLRRLEDVRDHADLAEGARREAKWRKNGYTVISMKNDFKTIYGEGVEKTTEK